MKVARVLFPVLVLLLSLPLFHAPVAVAFTPHQGDYFNFYEVANLGNGTGPDYSTYTERSVTNGMERMNAVNATGQVAANYTFSWTTTNSVTGTQPAAGSSGNYTFSSTSFLYLKRTDNQSGYGYVSPTVWFAMDNSLQNGATFEDLNTPMTISSTSSSYYLTSQSRNVDAILAQSGSQSYKRDDSYGVFAATYTWDSYFDPSSGYIIGYVYHEHDTNSTSGDGFDYTDILYVTSTSYPLTTAPATGAGSSGFSQYYGIIAVLIVFILAVIIIAVLAYAISRRRSRLPKHPPQESYRPPVPVAPPAQIDLPGLRQQPEQIVIKEVVKVKCRYC